jgi:hypothetical protein
MSVLGKRLEKRACCLHATLEPIVITPFFFFLVVVVVEAQTVGVSVRLVRVGPTQFVDSLLIKQKLS